MLLVGKANWWLPAWLDRALPHLNVEGDAHEGPQPHHEPRPHARPHIGEPAPAEGA
jgi:RND superfamily putative drug exporter